MKGLVKTECAGLRWGDDLIPLTVLFSPALRLRFRASWGTASNQCNMACNRTLFIDARQATHQEGIKIEVYCNPPPIKTIYIYDEFGCCQDGATTVWTQDGALYSALVKLPNKEIDSIHVHGVVVHEIVNILGLTPTSDKESVTYCDLLERPQALQEKDIYNLAFLYKRK
jgi:hypothetical protein